MRYLELRLSSGAEQIHPLFPTMAESDAVERSWMLDWNVTREETTMALFRIRGDRERVAAALDAADVVREFEVSPAGEGEFHVSIYSETVPVERRLWRAFNQRRSVLLPPLEYLDGEVLCRIVGSRDEIRATIEDVPDGVDVEVRRIGRFEGHEWGVRDRLTDRQVEAVEAAREVGYYEVPRDATAEDVARVLGCGPSTASELLRRAEAEMVEALFGR